MSTVAGGTLTWRTCRLAVLIAAILIEGGGAISTMGFGLDSIDAHVDYLSTVKIALAQSTTAC